MSSTPTVSTSTDDASSGHTGRLIRPLVQGLLGRKLASGRLTIVTPGNERIVVDGVSPGPHAEIRIARWRAVLRTLIDWELGFAEAYMAEDWSSPNLAALLELASINALEISPNPALRVPRPWRLLRHAFKRNSRRGSRRNIHAHYDLGNDFYARWLDAGMTYSSGLFSADDGLEAAQTRKLDRVTELLSLDGGESVLEIGCGWGGLAEHIVKAHACDVTGITLSREQLDYGRDRLAGNARVDLRLEDYRDVQGVYDRIASIEMIEAVGEAFWPTYFAKLRDLLRPGGVAVLQVITIDESRFEHYRRTPDFIQRYIFPGGMLPTKTILAQQVKDAGLELITREFFGASYARTLEAWQMRFQAAWPEISKLGFDTRFKRMWEYYLDYCRAGFETGAVDVGLYRLEK